MKRIPFLRYYNVFNIECVDGVKLKLPSCYVNDPIDFWETIINDMPSRPVIEHGGDEPYYNWQEDRVKVPKRENFILSDEYYATLFHELAHSTGHSSRLNRDTCMRPSVYGSRDYCKEELVAEISTCFLCGEAGISNKTIDNSAAYIKFWLERLTHILREDHLLRITVRDFDPVRNHFYDPDIQLAEMDMLIRRLRRMDARICQRDVSRLYLDYYFKALVHVDTHFLPGERMHVMVAENALRFISDYYRRRDHLVFPELREYVEKVVNSYYSLPVRGW